MTSLLVEHFDTAGGTRVTRAVGAAGDRVAKGQRLVMVGAMKMELALVAPYDGVVAELTAKVGAQVSEGVLLVRIEAEASA